MQLPVKQRNGGSDEASGSCYAHRAFDEKQRSIGRKGKREEHSDIFSGSGIAKVPNSIYEAMRLKVSGVRDHRYAAETRRPVQF